MKPASEATTVLEALTLALEYIESGWCQNGFAQGAHAYPCDARDPFARAVCAYGAINRATSDPCISFTAKAFLEKDWAATPTIPVWNDGANRSHRDVIQLFERAIARARDAQETDR